MTVNLEILTREFPKNAIKHREGPGRQQFAYVETQTVIRRLNEATGNSWDFRVARVEWHGDLLVTTGELTLPGLGTRTGTGVQRISERGGEDLVKGSASDALKNAARLFGVGLELYGEDYEAITAEQPATRQRDVPADSPTTPEMRDDLAALLKQHGWTGDDFNAWRRANQAHGWSQLTVEDAGKLAAEVKMHLRPSATEAPAAASPATNGAVDLDELEREFAAMEAGVGE